MKRSEVIKNITDYIDVADGAYTSDEMAFYILEGCIGTFFS